jgi:cytochrome c553
MLLRGLTAAVTILLTQGLVSADGIAEKAAACSGCHGENGVPTGAGIPIIWGQNEDYISTELRDMKTGARRNSQMVAVLQDMSEDDILTLAAYFASKPWPNLAQPRAPKADEDHFAEMASPASAGIGCFVCHQAAYLGDGAKPRLAGQSETYLRYTMFDFRSGERANNAWMKDLLTTYSLDDIRQMARVLAGM